MFVQFSSLSTDSPQSGEKAGLGEIDLTPMSKKIMELGRIYTVNTNTAAVPLAVTTTSL